YRGGPVLQRRLLEVLHPIEPRGHPIAADQHLARDLAVAALVGVEQRGYAEGRKPQQEQQRPGTGAQPWGEGPLPAARGCIDSHAKRDNALGVANLTLWIGTRKGAFALRADRQRRRWQLSPPQFLGHTIQHIVQDPRAPRQLLLAAKTGHLGPTVYRSGDRGRHWQEVRTPPAFAPAAEGRPARAVERVFWLTPGHDSEVGSWYAGTSPAGLFRSEDAGDTWAPV